MENYKLNRYSRQLLVLYFSSTQISIVIEKIVYFKLREAKYSSSIVLASNRPFPTKSYCKPPLCIHINRTPSQT